MEPGHSANVGRLVLIALLVGAASGLLMFAYAAVFHDFRPAEAALTGAIFGVGFTVLWGMFSFYGYVRSGRRSRVDDR